MAKTKKNENNCLLEVNKNILTMTVDLDEEVRTAESGNTIIGESKWQKLEDDENIVVQVIVLRKQKKEKKSKKDKD